MHAERKERTRLHFMASRVSCVCGDNDCGLLQLRVVDGRESRLESLGPYRLLRSLVPAAVGLSGWLQT